MLSQRLRHRITIKTAIEQRQPSGSLKRQWVVYECDPHTPIKDWPAEVLTGPGREPFASQAKQSESEIRVNMRWFPGLTSAMRLEFDGVIYDIVSIEKDRTGVREYRLRCNAGEGDGS